MRLRKAFVLAVVVSTPLALLSAPPASASVSVEMRIHQLIDGDRAEPLTIHYGLQAAARDHSRHMAMEGSLNHDNADARVNSAPPDPAEGDGAPDNGFPVAAWCENVTYSIGRTESEAADQLYAQWKRSGAHYRCLMDTKRNVGAVGVYYDGESWWATFIAEVDETPPGGGTRAKPAEAKPTPEPRAAPAATTAPDDDREHPSAAPSEAPDEPDDPDEPGPVAAATSVPSSDPRPAGTAAPSAVPERDGEPARIPVHVDPSVANADTPFAGTVQRASSGSGGPLGIGWQEVLGVAGVLSVATLLLKKRWVLAPT